jgi:hypothetical protein
MRDKAGRTSGKVRGHEIGISYIIAGASHLGRNDREKPASDFGNQASSGSLVDQTAGRRGLEPCNFLDIGESEGGLGTVIQRSEELRGSASDCFQWQVIFSD